VPALLDILRSLDEYDRERAAYLKGKNMTEPVHKQGLVAELRAEAGTGSGMIPLLANAADEIERLTRAISDGVRDQAAREDAYIEINAGLHREIKRLQASEAYAERLTEKVRDALVWLEAVCDELEDNSDVKDSPDGPEPNLYMRLHTDQQLAIGFLLAGLKAKPELSAEDRIAGMHANLMEKP
jgi:hypothetical protein